MTLALFAHPFSSYCWKALIALYENATPFEYRILDDQHPENGAELQRRWPIGRFPILVDRDATVMEATSIIEHLSARYPGPVALIPGDPAVAVEVRMMDRVFDKNVMTPMGTMVFDALRPAEHRDPYGVDRAHENLETIYDWLDKRMAGREWAAGDTFTLADCAAAPSLFYADWVHAIGDARPGLAAYRTRLLARPSVARVVDDARPYRAFFPLGAPDRD